MKMLSAFGFGMVFALGLGLAGMTRPEKIIGFLDITGRWDPSLLFVMGGAVLLSLVLFPLILTSPKPLLSERFVVPEPRDIDVPLLAGAGVFGIGWGLSGYCPGPALVSLVTASPPVLAFVAAMGTGLYLGKHLVR